MGSAAPPPGKMDEKLKSEHMQKEQFSMLMLYFESNQSRLVYKMALFHKYIQIGLYFRMHHFVVKFLKFSSPQAARGH